MRYNIIYFHLAAGQSYLWEKVALLENFRLDNIVDFTDIASCVDSLFFCAPCLQLIFLTVSPFVVMSRTLVLFQSIQFQQYDMVAVPDGMLLENLAETNLCDRG